MLEIDLLEISVTTRRRTAQRRVVSWKSAASATATDDDLSEQLNRVGTADLRGPASGVAGQARGRGRGGGAAARVRADPADAASSTTARAGRRSRDEDPAAPPTSRSQRTSRRRRRRAAAARRDPQGPRSQGGTGAADAPHLRDARPRGRRDRSIRRPTDPGGDRQARGRSRRCLHPPEDPDHGVRARPGGRRLHPDRRVPSGESSTTPECREYTIMLMAGWIMEDRELPEWPPSADAYRQDERWMRVFADHLGSQGRHGSGSAVTRIPSPPVIEFTSSGRHSPG